MVYEFLQTPGTLRTTFKSAKQVKSLPLNSTSLSVSLEPSNISLVWKIPRLSSPSIKVINLNFSFDLSAHTPLLFRPRGSDLLGCDLRHRRRSIQGHPRAHREGESSQNLTDWLHLVCRHLCCMLKWMRDRWKHTKTFIHSFLLKVFYFLFELVLKRSSFLETRQSVSHRDSSHITISYPLPSPELLDCIIWLLEFFFLSVSYSFLSVYLMFEFFNLQAQSSEYLVLSSHPCLVQSPNVDLLMRLCFLVLRS